MCKSCYEDYQSAKKLKENANADSSDKEKCPICGKLTDKKQIAMQGMCKSCYKDYQSAKKLKENAN